MGDGLAEPVEARIGSTGPRGEGTGEAVDGDSPGVIAPPPLIYVGGLGVGFGLQALLPAPSLPAAISLPAGAVLALAGGALARSFFQAFARVGTPVSPFRAPTRLVTDGPYRLTRNPGYLGMALG